VAEDDVVIVSSCRTALCKAKRGGFKDTPVDDLIAAVLKETIRRTGVEPEVRVRGEDVVVLLW
jgi:acetyl-CoA acyltransferase 1